MIRETSVEIGHLYKRYQLELENRYARRNQVRYIDQLLNELELLNLAEAKSIADPLRGQVQEMLARCGNGLGVRRGKDLTIGESMEALYDIQDTLLLGGLEGDELL
jgi:hypothetical protein